MTLHSLTQKRARYAWQCIQEVKEKETPKVRGKYLSYIRNAPPLFMRNGLGNTIAFYKGNSEKNGTPRKAAYYLILQHLKGWAVEQDYLEEGVSLTEWIIDEETSSLQVHQLMRELIALLNWLKSFASSELEGET